MNDIHEGYKELELKNITGVYVSENEIVITGFPEEDDEEHNCDFMGCTTVSHVIFRESFDK